MLSHFVRYAARGSASLCLVILAACQPQGLADLEAACLQEEDYALSISSCTQIIASGQSGEIQDYAWAHVTRGSSYQETGEMALALADFNTALSLDPDNTDAFYNRGFWHAENGDHLRAIADFDRSSRLSPDEADVYNERGLSWAALGDHDRAFADYEKALSLDPGYHFALTNRGFSHQALGNPSRALRDWEAGIRIGGSDEILWWQDYLLAAEIYQGAVDGLDSPAFRAALGRCAQNPDC